jgi:cytochrome c-type biogenesis protein CcmH/NrfF
MRHLPISASPRARILALVPALALLVAAGDDAARIERLGHQMMCVCGCNQILFECNHVGCAYSTRMRDELSAGVARGDSDEAVIQGFILNYGTTVLAVPPNRGFNRLAWTMPYAALGAGIVLVVAIVRRWRRRPPVRDGGRATPTQGRELREFREQARRETSL